MKVVISADEHLHAFKEFDKVLKDGKSFRLSLYEQSFRYVKDYMLSNNIKYWLHGGDFFHSKESISVPVLDVIGSLLLEIKDAGIEQVFLKGNHDIWSKDGKISSLDILTAYGEIIENVCVKTYGDLKVLFIPWDENVITQDLINEHEEVDIVIGHRMIAGAVMDGAYIAKNGETLDFIDNTKFKQMFLGHIHRRQQLKDNVQYIGSLLAHTFKDRGSQHGFIVYDTDTNESNFILNPHSPNFETLEVTTLDEMKEVQQKLTKNPNFFWNIKAKINSDFSIDSVKSLNLGNSRISYSAPSVNESRLKDADSLAPEDLLQKYIILNDLDDSVVQKGKTIIKHVVSLLSKP